MRQPGKNRQGENRRRGRTRTLKTLERVISRAGLASRRVARRWIQEGKIVVNGEIVRHTDQWVDLERDRITVNGKSLQSAAKSYILLYKPTGFVTTYRDPQGRPTVYDLVSDAGTWVAPVGRLDLETSGLLMMTNDTDFADRITNPEHKVAKTYLIKAATRLSGEQLEQLAKGVVLRDGPTRPAQVQRLRDGPRHTFLELTITEGRNRQVRRMIEAVGSRVLKLVRTGIGPLRIGRLQIGKWRRLEEQEVRTLAGL